MAPYYSTQCDYSTSATAATIAPYDDSTNSGYTHFKTEVNPRYLILDPDVRAYINKGFLLDFITLLCIRNDKKILRQYAHVKAKHIPVPSNSMMCRWNE